MQEKWHWDQEYFRKKLGLKYLLDRICAYVWLGFISPFFLLIFFLIKVDSFFHPECTGKVFYTEPRVSAGGVFEIIKFCTITKAGIKWVRSDPENRSQTICKKRTRSGKIIAKWYFDELPQVINIAKGQMSFVGPRPHLPGEYKKEIEEGSFYRQHMKAGLFGVPQACKRNPPQKQLFEKMILSYKAEQECLNTLDGLYARECIRRSIWQILWWDYLLIARYFIIFARG